ncbi:Serine hydroxymethyltransferase, cytosolic [Perkinsus chesapeaki]|uniref:Serine hydroxymethyltransferase, cytosolic n=1 Tax=Perkinsus chesapeaki TaxID=330153 RepID=A0A7J6LME4_PERCH|nr:Serine hydroxymethyltransferase, cytosolic [Perkinsus chesapeaki]
MVNGQGFTSIRVVEVASVDGNSNGSSRFEEHLKQIGCPCAMVPLRPELQSSGFSSVAVVYTNQPYRTHLEQIRDVPPEEGMPALAIAFVDNAAVFGRLDVGAIEHSMPVAKTRLVLSTSRGPESMRAELTLRGIDWQDDCADMSAAALDAVIAVENARRKKQGITEWHSVHVLCDRPPSQFKSRVHAPVSSSVDASKASGNIVWIAMLQQIPGVGADMAAAIASRYSTLPSLLEALAVSPSIVENNIATMELKVRSKQGTRKIGPAVASRITRVFTATSQHDTVVT